MERIVDSNTERENVENLEGIQCFRKRYGSVSVRVSSKKV